MNKKLIISAIAATALLSATGQINSPKNDGYYDRAMFMYQDENYQGCIDQMSRLLKMNPTIQQQEVAE